MSHLQGTQRAGAQEARGLFEEEGAKAQVGPPLSQAQV